MHDSGTVGFGRRKAPRSSPDPSLPAVVSPAQLALLARGSFTDPFRIVLSIQLGTGTVRFRLGSGRECSVWREEMEDEHEEQETPLRRRVEQSRGRMERASAHTIADPLFSEWVFCC